MITVRTNNHVRPFVYRSDVPQSVLAPGGVLDWTDDDDCDGYLCYRGYWYQVGQFIRLTGGPLTDMGWHGAQGDSYWSGTVIALDDDAEGYRIGSYMETSDD